MADLEKAMADWRNAPDRAARRNAEAEILAAEGDIKAASNGGAVTAPTPGQWAYEADVAACPTYHDGMPRRTWAELDEVTQWSWERDPRPRGSIANMKDKLREEIAATGDC